MNYWWSIGVILVTIILAIVIVKFLIFMHKSGVDFGHNYPKEEVKDNGKK
jgi:hypothetical protein